ARAGIVSREGLRAVIRSESGRVPAEEGAVAGSERGPGFALAHPLVNQEQVGEGDRLVIAIGYAAGSRVALQRSDEPRHGLEQRIVAEIDPRHPDVIGVMKRLERRVFERRAKLGVGHLFFSMSLCDADAARSREE